MGILTSRYSWFIEKSFFTGGAGQNGFSGLVTVFHERPLPERGTTDFL
jgi:hypothetical protein